MLSATPSRISLAERMPPRGNRRQARASYATGVGRAFAQQALIPATDHGRPVVVDPANYAPKQQGGGWGPFADRFLRLNESALQALDIQPEVAAGSQGVILRLHPAGRAGAVPLRSAQSGLVAGGLVVRPRFGWTGVGRVLAETGWHASPQFLDLPLVPGSGREVPPWVLAGPVLTRLAELLGRLRKGYREATEVLRQPRGTILWAEYVSGSFSRGRWHALPCRFPDLANDPELRRYVKWCLERVRTGLVDAGGNDQSSLLLVAVADRLLGQLRDVARFTPSRDQIGRRVGATSLEDVAIRRGVEAIGWIVDERGLGGGRELDGLAWQLPLPELWESYVETVVRREARLVGGEVKVGRLGQTTLPVQWSDSSLRTLSHLVPDFVVRRGRSVEIVDAKYKAHLAELDESGWYRMTDDAREAHRADFHQVLAYASLFEAEEVTATLVYPLRRATYEALKARGRDVSRARLSYGGRRVVAQLRGLPFGSDGRDWLGNAAA